ncbi:MAG: oxamate carbamoyltransferase subunit AllH family protein [Cellulomonas sp.]
MTITTASTAALAVLDAGDPLTLHSSFESGVNLQCGEYLVHVATEPRGGACSLGVSPADLDALHGCGHWEWNGEALVGEPGRVTIRLDRTVHKYSVEAPRLAGLPSGDLGRMERARAASGGSSWFDSGVGLELAWPRVRGAIVSLVERRPDAGERVRAVVGLGIGLTPSADDALVGALCVLSAHGATCAALTRELADWLRTEGASATTEVSSSYLRLALGGAFSEPLNRAVAGLTTEATDVDLAAAVADLCQIGATSGMDAALGVQIAWETLAPAPAHPHRN